MLNGKVLYFFKSMAVISFKPSGCLLPGGCILKNTICIQQSFDWTYSLWRRWEFIRFSPSLTHKLYT
eukprot:UN04749